MNETYLPGNARERILDLMKHGKVTQGELRKPRWRICVIPCRTLFW